jgi:hypothetical protein
MLHRTARASGQTGPLQRGLLARLHGPEDAAPDRRRLTLDDVLQIVTGMYFREGVPRHTTVHRAVFYTNSMTLRPDPIDLPVGRLLYDTSHGDKVSAVTIEATEELEAQRPDGTPEMTVSVGGRELLDDLAAVVAFALDVSFTRSPYQLDRIVPPMQQGQPYLRGAAGILARTFDPGVFIPPDSFEDARAFMVRLLALRRPAFDAAIRAIRRIVDASMLVADDPTSAYTQYVAALESFTPIATYPEPRADWDKYDGSKRKIVEAALTGLPAAQADRVRAAVLQVDQLSLRARFAACALAHVTPSFHREDAVEALRPIRAVDLPRALDIAYQFRSRNVHTLQTLAPELWNATLRADTLPFEGTPALSLQGLKRLARHVAREFVLRAGTGVDEHFDYRAHLPGRLTLQMAPQYWIHYADGLTPDRVPQIVEGFIDLLIPLLGGRADAEPLPDMRSVLERAEQMLAGDTRPQVRQPLAVMYLLWHAVMSGEFHRPRAAEHSQRYESDLDDPSMYGFVIRALIRHEIEWTTEQLLTLVDERHANLSRRKGTDVPLPSRLDAALLIAAADRVWEEDTARALTLIGRAVEHLPGDAVLIAIEAAARAGTRPAIDLLELALATGPWATEQSSGDQQPVTTPHDADDADPASSAGVMAESAETTGGGHDALADGHGATDANVHGAAEPGSECSSA